MALALLAVLSVPAHASAAANSCPKYEPMLRQYFPAKVVLVMSRIAYRESRCNARALSPVRKSTGRPDVGLLQIQGSWATVTRAVCKKQDVIKALRTAQCNVKVAGYLYKNGGLGHWRATSGK
jgi:membrane-bound lytic murein transglycosylase MltF